MKNKVRNSNIELLRIIAMLMIVFHHFIVHGVLKNAPDYIFLYKNNMISEIIACGGKIGVNLFILITSYYVINLDLNFKKQKNKIKDLVLPVSFYSLLILIFAILLHQ